MLQLLINATVLGAIYAIAALGFVLIHNVTGAVNFSHGALVLLGAYLGIMYSDKTGGSMWLALVLVAVTMALVGIVLEVIAFRPLVGKPFVAVFISTLALGLIVAQLILLIWGPQPRAGKPLAKGSFELGGVTVLNQGVIVVLLTVAVVAAQWFLFHRSRVGIRLRATADDATTASLMGIRTGRTKLLVFALAAALAGVAGVLMAPLSFVDPGHGGIDIMVKLYIAVVIGGFGSEFGALAGGLLLALGEVMTAAYFTSVYRDVVIFGALMLILIVRPSGIFGERQLREA
jgi:branched-chain amino acid transport system permease protein